MPTWENLHLESLIDATTLLLETKGNVDRVEHEIRVVKAQLLRRDEQLGGGDGGEVPMDVDQEVVAMRMMLEFILDEAPGRRM